MKRIAMAVMVVLICASMNPVMAQLMRRSTVTNQALGDSLAQIRNEKLDKSASLPLSALINYYLLLKRIGNTDSAKTSRLKDSLTLSEEPILVYEGAIKPWVYRGLPGGSVTMTANEMITAINNGTLLDYFHHGALGIGGSDNQYFLNWDGNWRIPPMPIVKEITIIPDQMVVGTVIPFFIATSAMVVDSIYVIGTGNTNISFNIKIGDSLNVAVDSLTTNGMYSNWTTDFQKFKTFITNKDTIAIGKRVYIRINVVAGTGYARIVMVCKRVNYTSSAPSTTTVTGTLSNFGSHAIYTTSAEETFTVSGSNLTPIDDTVKVICPSGFEASLTSGSGFNDTINILYPVSTLTTTTVYVHFVPTTAQAYSDNIIIKGGGASQKTIAASGTGTSTVILDRYFVSGTLSGTSSATNLKRDTGNAPIVVNNPHRFMLVDLDLGSVAGITPDSVFYGHVGHYSTLTKIQQWWRSDGSWKGYRYAMVAPDTSTARHDTIYVVRSGTGTFRMATTIYYNVDQSQVTLGDTIGTALYGTTATLNCPSASGYLVVSSGFDGSLTGGTITAGANETLLFSAISSSTSMWLSYQYATGTSTSTSFLGTFDPTTNKSYMFLSLAIKPY